MRKIESVSALLNVFAVLELAIGIILIVIGTVNGEWNYYNFILTMGFGFCYGATFSAIFGGIFAAVERAEETKTGISMYKNQDGLELK